MALRYPLALAVAALCVTGCSKKEETSDDKDDTDTTPADTGSAAADLPVLETEDAVVGYALNALSSSTISGAAALALESSQSELITECSNNGEPWDEDTGARMQPSHAKFAERTFYCQLRSTESPDAIRGAFEQNKYILCDLVKAIGTIDYTEAGTAYDAKILPTADCGWPEKSITEISDMSGGEGIPAVVTATSYATGDWPKSIRIAATDAGVDFTIYMHVSDSMIAFKQVEAWDQASRGDDSSSSLPADATGVRGGIVAVDLANGVLRAETGDTYWGRRTRIYAVGTLDKKSGAFSAISAGEGLQGNFSPSSYEGSTGLYGEVASVKGTEVEGFVFRAGRYGCQDSDGCDIATELRSGEVTLEPGDAQCSASDCGTNSGIEFGTDDADWDFWAIGAFFDDQAGSRGAFETWLAEAGLPTFTAVDKAPTLE